MTRRVTLPLIAMRADLEPVVVERLDVQLIAAARAIRGIAIDRGGDAHLLALLGEPVGVEVVDADANVIHCAWVIELVEAKKGVAETEVDPAVPRPAHDGRAEQRSVELSRLLDVGDGKRRVVK